MANTGHALKGGACPLPLPLPAASAPVTLLPALCLPPECDSVLALGPSCLVKILKCLPLQWLPLPGPPPGPGRKVWRHSACALLCQSMRMKVGSVDSYSD